MYKQYEWDESGEQICVDKLQEVQGVQKIRKLVERGDKATVGWSR